MSTKKSLVFISIVVLISIIFMSTLFLGNTNPTEVSDSSQDGSSVQNRALLDENQAAQNLRVSVSLEDSEFEALQTLSETFDSNHPGVTVQLENVPKEEAYSKYKKASQLGEAPDIMLLDNSWVNEFAALSYLSEVDELLLSDIQSLHISPMVSQVKWNGYIWGVPKDIDPYILVWNKNRLAAEEISEPPRSADELISMNERFDSEETGDYGIYFDFTDPYAFISLVRSLGESLHKDGALTKLEQFLFPNRAVQSGESTLRASYPEASIDWEPWELLNEGKIAMMIARESDFRKYAGEGIEMSALPILAEDEKEEEAIDGYGGWLRGRSYTVSAKSSAKEEAFQWIQSLSTIEAQLHLMKAGGALPVMMSAYESELIKSMPFFEETAKSIEQGSIYTVEPELSHKIRVLQSEIRKVWLGEQTLPQFTRQLHQSWNETTNKP